MKYDIYNQQGEKTGTTLLPKEIFAVQMNPNLVHQVVLVQQNNRRRRIAHTKNRAEVSGGGKKPWAQKGLGRARHGSIRSPIWRKGGVVFGPRKDKIFERKIPQKMKRKALFMVLSAKVKNNSLVLLESLKIENPKTKLMAEIIKNLPMTKKSILIALPSLDKDLILASRNIAGVRTIQAKDLNCLDLLSFKYLILPKESIKVIKETFSK